MRRSDVMALQTGLGMRGMMAADDEPFADARRGEGLSEFHFGASPVDEAGLRLPAPASAATPKGNCSMPSNSQPSWARRFGRVPRTRRGRAEPARLHSCIPRDTGSVVQATLQLSTSALPHRIDSVCICPVMRIVPQKPQCPSVADPVDTHGRTQPQREQLRNIVLPYFRKTRLCLNGQTANLDEMTVVATCAPASRAHDLPPRHRLEMLELRRDFCPPQLGGHGAPTPRSIKVRDPEGPYDCLSIMESWVAARSSARLFAARGKIPRLRLFRRPSGHG